MTLVIARRWGSRIIVMSETMISDRNARTPNAIPGRLKSVVVNKRLTVSYAGLSTQAIDAIRAVWTASLTGPQAIEFLKESSQQYNGEIDYIVCAHDDPESPRLVKIQDGVVFEGADQYWIGDAIAAQEVSRFEIPRATSSKLDLQQEEESEFTERFHQYVRNVGTTNVGGAVVNTLCSPRGHCYQQHALVERWDPIVIPNNEDPAVREVIHRTGITSYAYRVLSAYERGVCLVGCYLDQPSIGFIHDPLHKDEAWLVRADNYTEFTAVLGVREREILGREPVVDG